MPVPPESGVYKLQKFASTIHAAFLDPPRYAAAEESDSLTKTTEISKMKGQGLTGEPKSRLISVNRRFISYAMKEGAIRIINQNGKEMFKVSNSSKSQIMDMVLIGSGVHNESGPQTSIIVSIDISGCASIHHIEEISRSNNVPEDRMSTSFLSTGKKLELQFPDEDPPLRVLGGPQDNRFFVTVHAAHLSVWDQRKLMDKGVWSDIKQFASLTVDEEVISLAKCHACISSRGGTVFSPMYRSQVMEEVGSQLGTGLKSQFIDATISVDGTLLLAFTAETLYVWSLTGDMPLGAAIEPVQKIPLDSGHPEGLSAGQCGARPFSMRALGEAKGEGRTELPAGSPQVLVLFSESTCDMSVYKLTTSAPQPVGALMQQITIEGGESLGGNVDVDSINHDFLVIAFAQEAVILLLPLAKIGEGRPFPYVQRVTLKEPTHKLCCMTGRSYQTAGVALFIYRGYNFVREKDGLLGCNIVVEEVNRAIMPPAVAQEFPDEANDSMVSSAVEQECPDEDDPPMPSIASVTPAPDPPLPEWKADFPFVQPETPHSWANPIPTKELHQLPQAPTCPPPPPPGLISDVAIPPSDEAPSDENKAAPTAVVAGEEGAGVQGSAARSSGDGEEEQKRSTFLAPEEGRPDRPGAVKMELDYGVVKQIAASFVQGLEKRRGEMADKILTEVSEAMKAGPANSNNSADLALLDQALAKTREAKEAQASAERKLVADVRKASETWAESQATLVNGLLQKELSKISDGVAATLAQQLAQSRKFVEALARGVNKCAGHTTKLAVEQLRPTRQLQDTVGAALSEALHESLAPVFKSELRTHFEHELAPLVAHRVDEMMCSFRDRMSDCLEGIASEHEQAAKRLGRDIAPLVAEELRQVERAISQHQANASALSDAQLDELANSVQAEVIQPLQTRIRDLTSQVRTLREEVRELERRWNSVRAFTSGEGNMPPPSSLGGAFRTKSVSSTNRAAPAATAISAEEAQAERLVNLFKEGKVEDAFVKGMSAQANSKKVDFLGRLCLLVKDPGDWLAGDGIALSMPVKMLLMLSFARQLENPGLPEADRTKKLDWVNELWLSFDANDSTVIAHSRDLCAQLTDLLDKLPFNSEALRHLKGSVKMTRKFLDK